MTHLIKNDYTTFCGIDLLDVPPGNFAPWAEDALTVKLPTCKTCRELRLSQDGWVPLAKTLEQMK